MKRIIATGSVAALALVGFAGAASAEPMGKAKGKPAGIQCQQAGIGTLQSLGLLSAVAKGGIETSAGPLDFPTVLSLHRSNPELFQTGGVSVFIPGEDGEPIEVPATWCDGIK